MNDKNDELDEELIEAVAITAEMMGTPLSKPAANVFVSDLQRYPKEQVLPALAKCRREVRGRLTVADVIARLDDGRPGPEGAWAMIPHGEEASVVWTEEMATAFGVAAPLLAEGEAIQARMAFLEAYRKEISKARDAGRAPKWRPSLGHDKHGREAALLEAVDKGRLSFEHARRCLPSLEAPQQAIEHLTEQCPALKSTLSALESGDSDRRNIHSTKRMKRAGGF